MAGSTSLFFSAASPAAGLAFFSLWACVWGCTRERHKSGRKCGEEAPNSHEAHAKASLTNSTSKFCSASKSLKCNTESSGYWRGPEACPEQSVGRMEGASGLASPSGGASGLASPPFPYWSASGLAFLQ